MTPSPSLSMLLVVPELWRVYLGERQVLGKLEDPSIKCPVYIVPNSSESDDHPGLHSGGAQVYSSALTRYTKENGTTVALTAVWPPVDSRTMEMRWSNRTHNYPTYLQLQEDSSFNATVKLKFRFK